MNKSLVGVLLAAGSSQRFGSQKLYHTLPNGNPIVLQSAMRLMQALPYSIAVIRENDDKIRKILEPCGIQCVVNIDADFGLGSSIACGISNRYTADGWIIALGDMPYVTVNTISKIAHLINEGAKIAAPAHNGRRGHPVGFSSYFRRMLLSLHADHGARYIIQKEQAHLRTFEVDDAGIFNDIDLPEDIMQ